VFEIRSPQRLWGHLLITADLIAASLREEDQEAIEAFARQLGLLLDGAELLGRAVTTERSLAHAEKLAAIGELTARIAHEIRNPLTAARSLTQQLTREPGAPHAEEHGLILTELERIDRQVTDLLRFARRDELRWEPVDLAEVAKETAQGLRSSLAAAGIDLQVATNGMALGLGDREKLRQTLLNLIENARDALQSAAGRGCIRLDVQATNGRVRLDVIDDGPGIDEDALPHLFEAFFSRKPNGTGLGLAIVKRTVEAHGGTIEARRRAAGGMRFRIELPASGVSSREGSS
jgi:signal transduction histidine kinase